MYERLGPDLTPSRVIDGIRANLIQVALPFAGTSTRRSIPYAGGWNYSPNIGTKP